MNWDEFEEQQTRVEKSANIARVEQILEYSDIVWSKYGSDTIEELAEKIVSALMGQEKQVFLPGQPDKLRKRSLVRHRDKVYLSGCHNNSTQEQNK